MNEFSIWDLFVDLGFISVFLLIGIILRAKVRWIQSLFIPASIIAGIFGLILGPNGLGIVPFSKFIADYPTVLIAVIFGAIPIGAAKTQWKKTFGRVRNMWSYSLLMELLLWGGGPLFAILVLNLIWSLPDGFGLTLGAGFVGGHGTAAAVGEAFSNLGWEEALTLGYTSATVGIIVSIVGGLILVKLSARKKQTNYITDFHELPNQLRTGLIKKANRTSMGNNTLSSMTVDPLFFHLAILCLVIIVSFYAKQYVDMLIPQINIPMLSMAYVVGLLLQIVFRKVKVAEYIDKQVIDRLSGTATDLLVAFGIASIKLSIVMNYALPLIILFVFGIALAYVIFQFIAPRFFADNCFENALFGWGWSTGTVAMGLALLRIVDPDNKTTTLQDYSISYIALVPFEVLIITFGPLMMMKGLGLVFSLVLLGAALTIYLVARISGWLEPRKLVQGETSQSVSSN